MVRKSEATQIADSIVSKKKGQKQKNKGRKIGRNFKYYGTIHSQTLYRSRGQREKNKARRAAQRERSLQRLKDKRHAVHFKDNRPEDSTDQAKGFRSTQR